jgi:hypothetical protein
MMPEHEQEAKIGESMTDRDPTVEMAKLMAMLYYFMAKEIVDSEGEEKGRDIIRRAVWKFGRYRGAKIRENVDARGLPADLENLVKYYDMPTSKLTETEVKVTPSSYEEVTRHCTFADVWTAFGAGSLGLIYCEQDFALAEGFNKDIKCSRTSDMMEPGADTCELQMRLRNGGDSR